VCVHGCGAVVVAYEIVKVQGMDYLATSHFALLLCNGKKDRSFVTVHVSTKQKGRSFLLCFVVFGGANSFNSDLRSWNVSKVIVMDSSEYATCLLRRCCLSVCVE
jgi:hypothetical protein